MAFSWLGCESRLEGVERPVKLLLQENLLLFVELLKRLNGVFMEHIGFLCLHGIGRLNAGPWLVFSSLFPAGHLSVQWLWLLGSLLGGHVFVLAGAAVFEKNSDCSPFWLALFNSKI